AQTAALGLGVQPGQRPAQGQSFVLVEAEPSGDHGRPGGEDGRPVDGNGLRWHSAPGSDPAGDQPLRCLRPRPFIPCRHWPSSGTIPASRGSGCPRFPWTVVVRPEACPNRSRSSRRRTASPGPGTGPVPAASISTGTSLPPPPACRPKTPEGSARLQPVCPTPDTGGR